MKKTALTASAFVLGCSLALNGAFAAAPAAVGSSAPFKDLAPTHWAAQSMAKLKQYGLLSGYPDNSVKPDNPITRAEFAKIVNRLFGYPIPQSFSASDVPSSSWAYPEIAKATAAGYFKLDAANAAKPNQELSRAEAAAALAYVYRLSPNAEGGSAPFKDVAGLDADTQNAIRALSAAGYAKGFADGSFQPGKTISRAELATLLDRMTGLYANESGTVSAGKVEGNAIVNRTDIVLKDTTVSRNLILTPGIGDGDAELDHVSVRGETFIQGGGEHSIKIIGSQLGVVHLQKVGGKVRVVIDGTIEELIVENRSLIVLSDDAVIKRLIVTAGANDSAIEGKGKIDQVDNKATGVKLNGVPLRSTGPTGGTTGTSPTTNPGTNPGTDPWTLVWSDEFDGGSIDPAKWTYDLTNGASVGNPGWGNNELEYYTNRPENAKVENGNLVITARKENYEGFPYTSARLKTKGLFSKTYGKFEIRAKTPVGKGYWPAIWMLPENSAYGTWAASGEIDIMETWGSRPDTIAGTIHYGQQWPGNTYIGKEYKFENGTIADYHTYAIEWEPNEIRWYVDGHQYASQRDWYSKSADQPANNAYPAPFDQPFHLLLNLAVGGNFDGNPTDDTAFPQSMLVDYVRVYELTGRPYAEPVPPTLAKENYLPGSNLPQAPDNDLVYNANFTETRESDPGMGIDGTAYWSLFKETGPDAAIATIENIGGTNFAKITIANAGSNSYSVQPQAIVSLAKGRNYKLTFDAKTDTSREMNVKLTGGATRGFAAYSPALDVSLTGTMKSYQMSFQMKQDSDIAARIEFNMGTNARPVWIGNVKLVEIDEIQFDHDVPKVPFGAEGNHIYNGTFDQGEPNRLSYWHLATSGSARATASVDPTERKLRLNVTNGGSSADQVQFAQRGLYLVNGQQYRLTLDASSGTARDIAIQLRSKDGNQTFAQKTLHLTATETAYDVSFAMDGATTEEAELAILAGGASGNLKLDNIKLVRTSVYLDPSVVKFPLRNGQFDAGLAAWESFGLDGGTVTASDGGSIAKLSIGAVGPNPWSIMFNQGDLSTSGGVRYVVAFDAYATTNRKLEVIAENASYSRSFDQTVDLTATKQRYSFEFTKSTSETVALKFLLGKIDGDAALGAHDVYIDNVVFEPKAAVETSNLVANGQFGTDIAGWTSFYGGGVAGSLYASNGRMVADLSGSGGEFWNVQADYKNVTIEQNKSYRLSFDASASVNRNIQVVVEHAGEPYTPYLTNHTLALTTTPQTFSYTFTSGSPTDTAAHINFLLGKIDDAIGEAHSVTFDNVSLVEVPMPPVTPPEGHALQNGTFDTNTDGWTLYTGDGSNAAISVDDGKLKVEFSAYDGWFTWSTQVYQDRLKLETGKTYTVTFEASSSLAKTIGVEVGRGGGGAAHQAAKPFDLTSDLQSFTFDFTVTGNTDQNAKLNFLLGSNNVPGEQFVAHRIWIDNVSIAEKST